MTVTYKEPLADNLSIKEMAMYDSKENILLSYRLINIKISKNFLFCGSDNAAKNLAFAYSLTESCKLNNINPYDYWSDLIDFVGCEGVDLNSFVHSQWHKHTKAV